jgi:hypothetical protein
LTALKLRLDDLGDIIWLIKENELRENFAADLEPDLRGRFLEMLRELERST